MARLAGVSQKTVSRVVNQEPLVSEDVRRRVLAAAAELGYRPNSAARALMSGRSHRIGFVSLGTALHGPVATLVATERAARGLGYSLGITTTAEGTDRVADAVEALLQEGAEGIVICEPIDLGAIDLRIEVPVLVFGYMPGLMAPHVITVLMSGERNAQEATEYLFSIGHENVHHVAGPVSWYASRERVAGWRRAVRARAADEVAPLHGDWSAASGYEAGRRLARDPSVSAIFAANDDMAIGVIRAMTEAGRSVPGGCQRHRLRRCADGSLRLALAVHGALPIRDRGIARRRRPGAGHRTPRAAVAVHRGSRRRACHPRIDRPAELAQEVTTKQGRCRAANAA